MQILSLGSNCEVGKMIETYASIIPNSMLESTLFGWANIKIKDMNYLLKNPELLNDSTFKIVYRLMNGDRNNSRNGCGYYNLNELHDDISKISNIDSVHIDIESNHENIQMWTHGVIVSLHEFIQNDHTKYIHDVTSKLNYLIKKTSDMMYNTDRKVYVIKCLKNEYTLQDIIDFNNILLTYSSQNYMSIIVEEDSTINLDNITLKNTTIVCAPKLTGHDEAIYSDRYNTFVYYHQLFEKTNRLLYDL